MFGERYFATRQRLTDVVTGVRELGEACEAEIAELADEGEFFKGLRSPHLFLVCGEVNAGKSTFLNGLFGRELCQANILPETEKVQHFRWGKESKVVEVTDSLQERYQPIEFLQDFHIVDTPGTNSVDKGHLALIERFLPVADLLFFVFPVSNPWGAATWDFVSKLSQDNFGNVAFILQQKDLREEKEIALIVAHIRALAVQKIGVSPPVFPVSARLAVEAKNTQPLSDRTFQESGYPALEEFISRCVSENMHRRQVLSDVWDSAQVVLRRIERKIEERTQQLDRDQRFLSELEEEVDLRREKQANEFPDIFAVLPEVFMSEARESVEALDKRITILQSLTSLFRAEKLAADFERMLSDAVEKAIEKRVNHDGQALVSSCREHWKTVVPRIEDRLEVPIPDFNQETDALRSTRERFARRLGRSAKQAVANLKLRGSLNLQMESRRSVLRRYLSGSLCAIIAAGVLGALAFHPWPLVALVGALLGLIAAAIYAKKSQKTLRQNFVIKVESCREPFADSLNNEYRDGVREFYLEYAGLFESVRRYIAEHKLSLKPRLEQWNDLFLELKAIEQEI